MSQVEDEVRQAVVIELEAVVRRGWTVRSVTAAGPVEIEVVGPDGPGFNDEVWRLARFVAYDDFVSIERVGQQPAVFLVKSRSRSGLAFDVRVVASVPATRAPRRER